MKIPFARAFAAVILGLLVGLPSLSAQKGADVPSARKGARGGTGAPACVWKIEGEKNTVYLAGSMHLLREGDLPLPRQYMRAFKDSDRLVFEIAPGDENSPKAARLSLEKGTYSDGKTLPDEISEDAYKEVGRFLEHAGMPAGSFDKFRPWMCAMTVTMVEMMKIGAMPQFGVEQILQELAEAEGKEIAGLETLEFQLDLFGGMERKLQERMLVESVREAETIAEEFPKMVEAWRIADEEAFEESAFEDKDDPEVKAFYEVILYGRNRDWIGKIVNLLEGDENVMVVVGAGHLMGEGSVVELLREKGYKIAQLKARGKRGKTAPDSDGKPAPKPDAKPKSKKRDLVPVGVPTVEP